MIPPPFARHRCRTPSAARAIPADRCHHRQHHRHLEHRGRGRRSRMIASGLTRGDKVSGLIENRKSIVATVRTTVPVQNMSTRTRAVRLRIEPARCPRRSSRSAARSPYRCPSAHLAVSTPSLKMHWSKAVRAGWSSSSRRQSGATYGRSRAVGRERIEVTSGLNQRRGRYPRQRASSARPEHRPKRVVAASPAEKRAEWTHHGPYPPLNRPAGCGHCCGADGGAVRRHRADPDSDPAHSRTSANLSSRSKRLGPAPRRPRSNAKSSIVRKTNCRASRAWTR